MTWRGVSLARTPYSGGSYAPARLDNTGTIGNSEAKEPRRQSARSALPPNSVLIPRRRRATIGCHVKRPGVARCDKRCSPKASPGSIALFGGRSPVSVQFAAVVGFREGEATFALVGESVDLTLFLGLSRPLFGPVFKGMSAQRRVGAAAARAAGRSRRVGKRSRHRSKPESILKKRRSRSDTPTRRPPSLMTIRRAARPRKRSAPAARNPPASSDDPNILPAVPARRPGFGPIRSAR
jgi:hypothetical protein